MKIRSAVPENGCQVFLWRTEKSRKQTKTSVKHIRNITQKLIKSDSQRANHQQHKFDIIVQHAGCSPVADPAMGGQGGRPPPLTKI